MQGTPTNDASSRRPTWLRVLRIIVSRWSLLIIIACFLIFVIINIPILTNPATYTDRGSIPALDIPLLILMLALLPLGYLTKKDVEREQVLEEPAYPSSVELLQMLPKFGNAISAYPSSVKLLQMLPEFGNAISDLVWSPDGSTLALNSFEAIYLWDFTSRHISQIATGRSNNSQQSISYKIAWSSNGQILAYMTSSRTIQLWNRDTKQVEQTFIVPSDPIDVESNNRPIQDISWSPDGQLLAATDSYGALLLCNLETGENSILYIGWGIPAGVLAWSLDGQILAASSTPCIYLLDRNTGQDVQRITLPNAPTFVINVGWKKPFTTALAWSPDRHILASNSSTSTGTVYLWDARTGSLIRTLEGHTNSISKVAFFADGLLFAARADDATVRIWRTDTWQEIVVFEDDIRPSNSGGPSLPNNWRPSLPNDWGMTFHPALPIIATLAGEDLKAVRIREIDVEALLGISARKVAVSYANARVVLVGDSGVGKSGLGLVLSGQPFELTKSTHGRHVWVFGREEVVLGGMPKRKEERETLLWDLAGQPGYHLIHQLHLNEVAVALVVFDARSETDPFAGVYYWERALRQALRVQGSAAPPLKKLLVAARVDRGGIGVSRERIQRVIDELGFDGYFETSASEGWGIEQLQTTIRGSIDWDVLPRVSSTELFQQIKAFLVRVKETGRFLSVVDDLYQLFLSAEAPEETSNLYAQFETCIRLVEAAGLIKRLSFGKLVLLQPEMLDAYASALVNAVKEEPDGLGSFPEEQVRVGNFRMAADERIKDREQEKLLLIAMIEDLLRRELVLREERLLVFPSQSTRENPDLPDPEGKAVTFRFEGPVLNIYSTLAVRLANSGLFKKKELWKNAITYMANVGGECGMFLRYTGEGQGELTLFFNNVASWETRRNFEHYVQVHLQRSSLLDKLKRFRIFVCRSCQTPMSEQIIQARRSRSFDWLDCPVCGTRVSIAESEEQLLTASPAPVQAMDRSANEQRDLAAAQSTVQGKEATEDYDVFLCYSEIDRDTVLRIEEQLRKRGILPWLDERELRPGLPSQPQREYQVERVKAAAVFIGRGDMGKQQEQELYALLNQFAHRSCPVIPVFLPDVPPQPKLPTFLQNMHRVDFRRTDPDPLEQLIYGITGKR